MTRPDPIEMVLYLAAGGVLGAVYFTLLVRTVRLYTAQVAASRIIPLHLLRIALAVLAFWLIAQQGAWPLLAALAGFLLARLAVQRWMKEGP